MQRGKIYPFCEEDIAKMGSIANDVKTAIFQTPFQQKQNTAPFKYYIVRNTLNSTEANAVISIKQTE